MLKRRLLFIFVLIFVKTFSIELNAGELKGDIDQINKQGFEYLEEGNYSEAIKQFKKLVLLRPNLTSSHYNLGMAYYKSGNKKKAKKMFQKVVILDPTHTEANKMIDQSLPHILKIPVIYYDFKCDRSNPNFESKKTRIKGDLLSISHSELTIEGRGREEETYKITKDTKVYGWGGPIPGGVSAINPMNIPPEQDIKFQVDPRNPYWIVAIEDPTDEYLRYRRKSLRTGKFRKKYGSKKGMIYDYLNKDRKPVLRLYRQNEVNYRLDEWFYPSGIKGTDAEFVYDILEDKWKWKGLKEIRGKWSGEFIGKNFKTEDAMANVVIHDYLEFKLERSGKMIEERNNKSENGKERKRLIYIFDALRFFPIDGKGFREVKTSGSEGTHNYSYTMELHTTFLYRGGEYFDIRGDDDIYVFINGKLEIDMGGIHGAQKSRIELDTIPGLQKGNIYPFDLFFAERQTSGSSLRIEGLFVFDEPEPVVMGIMADRDTFIPGDEQVEIFVIGMPVEHQVWLVGIYGADGHAIKLFKGKGEMQKVIEWDGKDENGKLVQGGKQFRLLARGIDPDGEEWESNLITLKSEMKLKVGSKIVISAINFEPFSYTLTSRSKITLGRVYKILKEFSIVRLLIKGHVASVNWSKEALLELSQNRAEAVKQYLVDQGIAPGRLEAKGYGDTQPIGNNDTEEGRKLNRRTEFEVIK